MSRGRPRSSDVDQAIADAVRSMLGEVGYQGMSIAGVAARAGVGKSGIYRRWRSKAEMVYACVVHGLDIEAPSDKGSLRADLTALIEHIIGVVSVPIAMKAIPGLMADVAMKPDLAARFDASFVDRERVVLSQIFSRAVERGEIVGHADPVFTHAQVLGAIFAWFFLLSAEPPPDLAERLAESLAVGLEGASDLPEPLGKE